MEKKLSVLLVEDDEKECNLIAQYIDELDDVSLVGTTDNSEQGIEYVKDFLPEAIILDLELHQGGGDGLTFLKELRYLNLRVKPYVLVTTNNSSMVTYQCARRLGADFIMAKQQADYSAKNVVEFLRMMKETIQAKAAGNPLTARRNRPSKRPNESSAGFPWNLTMSESVPRPSVINT